MPKWSIVILCLSFVLSCEKPKDILKSKTDFKNIFLQSRTIHVPDTLGLGHYIAVSKYLNEDSLFLFELGTNSFFHLDFKHKRFTNILKQGNGPNELISTSGIAFSDSSLIWGNSYSNVVNEIAFDGRLINTKKINAVAAGFPSVWVGPKLLYKQPFRWTHHFIDQDGVGYFETPLCFRQFRAPAIPGFFIEADTISFLTPYEATVYKYNVKTQETSRKKLILPIDIYSFEDRYNDVIPKDEASKIERTSYRFTKFERIVQNKKAYYFVQGFHNKVFTTFLLDEQLELITQIINSPLAQILTAFKNKIVLFEQDEQTGDAKFVEYKLTI